MEVLIQSDSLFCKHNQWNNRELHCEWLDYNDICYYDISAYFRSRVKTAWELSLGKDSVAIYCVYYSFTTISASEKCAGFSCNRFIYGRDLESQLPALDLFVCGRGEVCGIFPP